ncbi:hypothetical protein [Oceanibacterium hippocampi]|uniref:Uncharacterized protein n=1 Tax=Oceanibacterium hippocampi TaxID=745714 RepID=A0A1Y5S4V8_9PROT|nr:hypothetical protein [Oceanibacterium hippocampi]SLN31738.1 hypothetical protein OCH7691_01147 [Oceanibacterium hippocampi]
MTGETDRPDLPAPLDLQSLDIEAAAGEGASFTLRHPVTDEPLVQDGRAITITLCGADSRRWKAMQRANLDRRLRRGRAVLKSAQIEEENIELLAHCTRDWQGIVYGGEALACTEANARRLYREQSWIREQALQFAGERANFLGEH